MTNNLMKTSKSWQYKLGLTFIFIGMILPVFSFFVPFLGFSTGESATIIAILTIGGPEVGIILGIALAGKEGYETIKNNIIKLFRYKTKTIIPVSRQRYNIGLVLFFIGLIIPVLTLYIPWVLDSSFSLENQRYLTLVGDLIFIVSLFVLGDQFWDKLKRLFVWEKKYEPYHD